MGGTNGFKAITIVAGLGGLLFGYDTGVISGALLYIRNSFQLSSSLQGLVVAVTLAGAAIGAAIIGPIADRFGRRIVLLAIALVFVGGALLCASAWSFEILVVGRFILGLAIGVASMLTPLYLSEIADASRRGGIVTLNQLFITLGLFLSFLVDFALAYFGQGSGQGGSLTWRLMLGAAAVPGALLFAGMLVLPESPRWLLGRGKIDAAEAALRRLRPGTDPARAFEALRQDISKTERADGGWAAVFSARVRIPLVVGVGLAIFQQITGINTVIYFAPTVFTDSGIATATGAILVTAGIGLVNVIFTIVAVRLLDKVGRRNILLVGLAGMFVSLLILGACFAVGTTTHPELAWGIILFIAIYVAFFAIGLGPVFWLLISEIFPLAIRARAMSVATIMNWVFNMLVSFTFLDLNQAIGRGNTFYLYAALTLSSILFTWYLVPETMGRSLEEIEAGQPRVIDAA